MDLDSAVNYSRQLNRCRIDIGTNNFIIDKKYRSTLIRALKLLTWSDCCTVDTESDVRTLLELVDNKKG